MADNDIRITFLAEQTQLLAELTKQANAIQRVSAKWSEVKKRADEAGEAQGSVIEKGVADIGRFAAQLSGVGSAAGAVLAVATAIKAEYADMLSRQKAAATEQMSLAQKQAEAIRNLGKDKTVGSGEELQARIRKMSEDTGLSETVLTGVASGALSARGELSADEALKAVAAAAKLAPDLGEQGLTESAMGAMGLIRRGAKPEEALGFLLSIGKTSPIKSLENTMKNVAPAINKVAGFGGSTAESGALVSALATGMEDRTGEESGTAAVRLAEQLAERLPGMGSTAARIDAIRKDAKLRKKIFDPQGGDFKITDEMGRQRTQHFPQIEARAAAVTAYRELLGAGGKVGSTGQAFDAFLKETPNIGPQAALLFDEEVAKKNSTEVLRRANLNRASEAGASRQMTTDLGGGTRADVRAAVEKNLSAAGYGPVDRFLYDKRVQFASDPAAAAADIFKYTAEQQAREAGRTDVRSSSDIAAFAESAKTLNALAKQFVEYAKKTPEVKVVVPPGIPIKPAAAAHDGRRK